MHVLVKPPDHLTQYLFCMMDTDLGKTRRFHFSIILMSLNFILHPLTTFATTSVLFFMMDTAYLGKLR